MGRAGRLEVITGPNGLIEQDLARERGSWRAANSWIGHAASLSAVNQRRERLAVAGERVAIGIMTCRS